MASLHQKGASFVRIAVQRVGRRHSVSHAGDFAAGRAGV
jgi:hypothetical protein